MKGREILKIFRNIKLSNLGETVSWPVTAAIYLSPYRILVVGHKDQVGRW